MCPGDHLGDETPAAGPVSGVQVRQRLVEQERPRLPHEGSADPDPTLLAGRQRPRPPAHEATEAQAPAPTREPVSHLRLGCTAHPQAARHVRRDVQGRVEPYVLEDHRDVPNPSGLVGAPPTGDEHVPGHHALQARYRAQHRRLAAAGRPEHREHLARPGEQRHIAQHRHAVEHHRDVDEPGAAGPGLTGRHGAPSLRGPTPDVSLLDLLVGGDRELLERARLGRHGATAGGARSRAGAVGVDLAAPVLDRAGLGTIAGSDLGDGVGVDRRVLRLGHPAASFRVPDAYPARRPRATHDGGWSTLRKDAIRRVRTGGTRRPAKGLSPGGDLV
jgi:hypothetical protein